MLDVVRAHTSRTSFVDKAWEGESKKSAEAIHTVKKTSWGRGQRCKLVFVDESSGRTLAVFK
jgi:hypothetical protein